MTAKNGSKLECENLPLTLPLTPPLTFADAPLTLPQTMPLTLNSINARRAAE